ncbi:MAG: ribbon-helix-helix domain-containing protein [Anaerorhabdus sp.]
MVEDKNLEKKKQLPLRLSPTLWNEIQRWADDEFRSVNGQIEFLLNEAVKKRKKGVKSNDNIES